MGWEQLNHFHAVLLFLISCATLSILVIHEPDVFVVSCLWKTPGVLFVTFNNAHNLRFQFCLKTVLSVLRHTCQMQTQGHKQLDQKQAFCQSIELCCVFLLCVTVHSSATGCATFMHFTVTTTTTTATTKNVWKSSNEHNNNNISTSKPPKWMPDQMKRLLLLASGDRLKSEQVFGAPGPDTNKSQPESVVVRT